MKHIGAVLVLTFSFVLTPALALAEHHEGDAGKGPKVEKSMGAEKSQGEAQGDAMRERRDDGKAIKDAYKEDVKAGGERVKGKKPWWKFWGSDD